MNKKNARTTPNERQLKEKVSAQKETVADVTKHDLWKYRLNFKLMQNLWVCFHNLGSCGRTHRVRMWRRLVHAVACAQLSNKRWKRKRIFGKRVSVFSFAINPPNQNTLQCNPLDWWLYRCVHFFTAENCESEKSVANTIHKRNGVPVNVFFGATFWHFVSQDSQIIFNPFRAITGVWIATVHK